MSYTIRERLGFLIAAATAACVTQVLGHTGHPAARAKYLRELRDSLELPAAATAEECFAKLARRTQKLDRKLADAGFPAARTPTIHGRGAAEGAMSYLHSTYVGGASPGEIARMEQAGIRGFTALLDAVAKARNVLALMRYLEGDFARSRVPAERRAHEAIQTLMPYVSDYWADLLVIDRDAIVDRLPKGETLWLWIRQGGWGSYLSEKPARIPDEAIAVVKVCPDGVALMRRAPQLDLAA